MGTHYSLKFKYHIVKLVLEEHWGVREAAQHFHIATHSSVVVWLQRFENTVSMDFTVNVTKREKTKCQKPRKSSPVRILRISKHY